ncbi:hypothetical protein HY635_00870 [Candidatus Uhrbacteria bacterium]|nr:hypothetical protein [Candidatus Uhrbacteria bacterium]
MPITDDTIVTFYDPHPGFAGAVIPIPAEIKEVADDLDGRVLPLGDALRWLRAAAKCVQQHGIVNADIEVVSYITHQWIRLRLYERGPKEQERLHVFRVINFREA